jgi:hypothetical protein
VHRWNGSALEPIGSGVTGLVTAVAVYDAGNGPELYAGGQLTVAGVNEWTFLVRWDGSAWHPIPGVSYQYSQPWVFALVAHDDGSGSKLYAGGRNFGALGGVTGNAVVRWDGSTWSGVGSATWQQVDALEIYNEGMGPRLFIAGYAPASPPAARYLARWDGVSFTDVGGGLATDGLALQMTVGDLGAGQLLCVATWEPAVGSALIRVQTWDGSAWTASSPLSPSASGRPTGVTIADVGSGPRPTIIAPRNGSMFVSAWSGSAWSQLGDALVGSCGSGQAFQYSLLETLDLGSGPRLCVSGGVAQTIGGDYSLVQEFDGSAWIAAGSTMQGLFPGTRVGALCSFDSGNGPELYMAGDFCQLDGHFTRGVARRRGSSWEPLSFSAWSNVSSLSALAPCDLGSGPALYAGGQIDLFGNGNGHSGDVVRWQGSYWESVGVVEEGYVAVYAITSGDIGNGPRVYIGGSFLRASGWASPNLSSLTTSGWVAMPPGPTAGVNGIVNALAICDLGSGPALYAGGTFVATTGGLPVNHVASWNGTSYAAVGGGLNGDVLALKAFDDGTGTKLYAAGAFTSAGGMPASRIACFDGTTWSPVGVGFDQLVKALEVFDDGSGPALCAAGDFMTSGGSPLAHAARWNGTTWTALGSGLGPSVLSLAAVREDPAGPETLWLAGRLETAGALPTSGLARWRGCRDPIDRFCFGDGTNRSCPCDNASLASRGCNNSANTGGARLNAMGTANPDTLSLHAAGETASAATLVFQGDVLRTSPTPFGDGLLCLAGNLKRLYTLTASGGSLTVPGVGQPSLSQRSAQLGDVLTPGSVRGYQAWYRDPAIAFCPPPSGDAWNISNAVRIVW